MVIQKSGQDFGSNSFYAQTFTMHYFCRSFVASFSFSSDYIYLYFLLRLAYFSSVNQGRSQKVGWVFFIGSITRQNKAVLFLSASYCVSPASGGFIMVNYSWRFSPRYSQEGTFFLCIINYLDYLEQKNTNRCRHGPVLSSLAMLFEQGRYCNRLYWCSQIFLTASCYF